jgi:thiosulfate/3-mercaptopyruvate sulfurtransferase
MTRTTRPSSLGPLRAVGVLALAGFWLPAGGQTLAGPQPMAAPGDVLDEQAVPHWPLVTGDWLEANLQRPGLVILHASRDGSDYEAGHIPGARLVPADRIAWEGEAGVGSELRSFQEIREVLEEAGVSDWSTVLVYGSDVMQAARLWMTLDVAGAGTGIPLLLDGGLPVWNEEGRPLAIGTPASSRGSLTLRPDPEKLATAEWILARLGHDDLALLDARPEDQFLGTDGGANGGLNPGHIPNARHLMWEWLVEAPERPLFRTRDELEAIFRASGAHSTDQVVTYCGVGMRASVTYMIARVLGYEARIYDGSWREWGATDYPHIPRTRRETGG